MDLLLLPNVRGYLVAEALDGLEAKKLLFVIPDRPKRYQVAPIATYIESLEASRVPYVVYDRVRVEPTDDSFRDAIAFARQRPFDGDVLVGSHGRWPRVELLEVHP